MTALDALWHVLNAVAAPIGVSALSIAALKLLWRQESRRRSVIDLLGWSSTAATATHLGAWAIVGAEGSMAGYAAMVCAVAFSLWLRVFAVGR